MIATQKDMTAESEYIEEISSKLASLCTISERVVQNSTEAYSHFQKLKYQLHVISMDLVNYQSKKATMKMTAKTYQLLEDVKHKLYTTIDHIKAISTMEGDKQILFLWKKLLGDYYRNLAVIVPEESQNARTMYKDALDICTFKHTHNLYISLILDYSCLLAENFNDKREALRMCLKLLLELQKQKHFAPDSVASAYLKFIRRNVVLWRKQL